MFFMNTSHLKIKRIMEDDFGCEELPEGAEIQVLVLLCDAEGNEQTVRMSDRLAQERDLKPGDPVFFCADGTLEREDAES